MALERAARAVEGATETVRVDESDHTFPTSSRQISPVPHPGAVIHATCVSLCVTIQDVALKDGERAEKLLLIAT